MSASMVAMSPESNPPGTGHPADDPADLAALHEYAVALADGVAAALPRWVQRNVLRVHALWREATVESGHGRDDPETAAAVVALRAAAEQTGAACAAEVGTAVRELLMLDIDDQRVNPLAVVRRAVTYPTAVLRAAGVPAIERDRQAVRQFPDDDYDLTPASFADLDPALHEPGLRWGAAKAHVHLRRHRAG
jgi:hypothetical protein